MFEVNDRVRVLTIEEIAILPPRAREFLGSGSDYINRMYGNKILKIEFVENSINYQYLSFSSIAGKFIHHRFARLLGIREKILRELTNA